MPDVLTEFINNANLTLPMIQAGVPVVANAAGESAVVKDVLVTCANATRPLSLGVGSIPSISFTGSTRLTGTEIVGQSTSLVLKTSAAAVFNTFYVANSQSSVLQSQIATVFTSDSFTGGGAITQTQILGTAATSNITFHLFDQSGNYYYSGENSGVLYRRAGGINGVETSIPFGTYTMCYDGIRYIYGLDSSKIYTYDTQTATISSVAYSGITPATASYCSCAAMDGRVVYRAMDSGNGVVSLINPATGVGANLFFGQNTSTRYYVGINKDTDGNYYVWHSYNGSANNNIFWWNIGPSITAPASSKPSGNFGVTNSAFNSSSLGSGANGIRAAGNADPGRAYFMSTTLWVADFNAKTLVPFTPGSGTISGALFVPAVDQNRATTDFGQIGIRATGIKTT
jgi:hypothetical protein